jgi:ppGpp synthetase/RelA/SpoT-type nucleotidyltranferase
MPLSAPEIDVLVDRYRREMTRYEEAARLVEDRLRRATRASAVRVLLSARAKHPEDLRKKLAHKSNDPRYAFAALERALDTAVTDLAGCRVMAYRMSDVAGLESVVREAFELAALPGALEHHDKPSGYRATHMLVAIGPDEERISLRGTICVRPARAPFSTGCSS